MGTPIQFGDVAIKALEICAWIKTNCFDSINNASLIYLDWKNDIINLSKRLKQFRESFEKVAWSVAGSVEHAAALKREADGLVGDFVATLKDCKRIIKEHAEFEHGRATALENAFWHTTTQPLITELRRRLQQHHYNLYLFIEPYELELLADVSANTNELLYLMRQQAGLIVPVELPAIPPAVEAALQEALRRDAPVRISSSFEIPLQEGVDALSRHYRECTFQSDSLGIGPGLQSNLSLLKAHWLFLVIENSTAFAACRRGSLFRRIVEQLGQGIEKQYRKRDITEWSDDIFSDLDIAEFALWPVRIEPKNSVMTDPADREETLVEAPLVCHRDGERQDLVIFRANEKQLRMVESRSRLDDSFGSQMMERWIHLDEDRFIPMYAIAAGNGRKGTVNMTHGNGARLESYEFKSRKSVLKVQEAFTGYEVIKSWLGVLCSLTYKVRFSIRTHQEIGQGEFQMWMEPGSLNLSDMPMSPTATVGGSDGSMTTGSSYTLASQTFSAFDPRVMSVNPQEDGGEMILSKLPEPPLLVFFVKGKKHYSIWQCDLSSLILGHSCIVTHKDRPQTYRVTLQVPKVQDFTVRRLTVTESQLNLWNLRALQTAASKTKSKDKSLPTVETLEATGIDLDFATLEAFKQFEKYFKAVWVARAAQVEQYATGRKVAISQAHKPSRRTSNAPAFPRKDSGPTGSESTIRGIPRDMTEKASRRLSHVTTFQQESFAGQRRSQTIIQGSPPGGFETQSRRSSYMTAPDRKSFGPTRSETTIRGIPPGITGVYPDFPPSLDQITPLPAIDLDGDEDAISPVTTSRWKIG